MAFQSVPETAKVFTQFYMNGQYFGNTYYFRNAGGYSEQDIQDLGVDMDDWIATELLPNLSDVCTYVGTTVTGLENEEDYQFYTDASAANGGQTGSNMPNNVALCMKRVSALTGRSARGRVYIGGLRYSNLSATINDKNSWSVATLVAILGALLEIATYALQHGWVEVIVSRWHNNMKRATAVTAEVTDWSFTDVTVDSQRGRLH